MTNQGCCPYATPIVYRRYANSQPEKGLQIVDRHSKCGVSVNGVRIGDHAGVLSAPLHDGALVIIGTHDSPYRFSFITGFDNAEMLRSPAALSQATDRT